MHECQGYANQSLKGLMQMLWIENYPSSSSVALHFSSITITIVFVFVIIIHHHCNCCHFYQTQVPWKSQSILCKFWTYIVSFSVYKSLLNLCKYVVEMHQHVHSPKDSCGLAAIWSKKTTF